jgi:hypothetical protein
MTTTTSRRAILAGIAAAPTLAAPALADPSADAELLEYGRRFSDLKSKYDIAAVLSKPSDDAFDAAMSDLDDDRQIGNEEFRELIARIDREDPQPSPCCDDLSDMMDPIMRTIMALPATTLAGLVVKARVAQDACSHYWNEPERDANWDKLMARKLIEAVLNAAVVY